MGASNNSIIRPLKALHSGGDDNPSISEYPSIPGRRTLPIAGNATPYPAKQILLKCTRIIFSISPDTPDSLIDLERVLKTFSRIVENHTIHPCVAVFFFFFSLSHKEPSRWGTPVKSQKMLLPTPGGKKSGGTLQILLHSAASSTAPTGKDAHRPRESFERKNGASVLGARHRDRASESASRSNKGTFWNRSNR